MTGIDSRQLLPGFETPPLALLARVGFLFWRKRALAYAVEYPQLCHHADARKAADVGAFWAKREISPDGGSCGPRKASEKCAHSTLTRVSSELRVFWDSFCEIKAEVKDKWGCAEFATN